MTQDIFHNWVFFHAHGHLHGHVIDVHQIQWFSTKDGLHRGYLGLSLENTALLTVADTHHHSLGHAWPPESFPEEAKCVVSTLMAQVSMAPIYRHLSLQSWHYKYQDIFIAPFRHNPQTEEIAPEYEVLLVGSIDPVHSASGTWCFRYWSSVQWSSFLLFSQSITNRIAMLPHCATTQCELARFW